MEPKKYIPCGNCEKRLLQVKNHINCPFHDSDFSYIPDLFRDVYLHCPGTDFQAFAKFASENITAVLESWAKSCRPPNDMYKATSVLRTQGKIVELAKRLLEVTTRQELTFLMFQANEIGTEISNTQSYENYERNVNDRVGKLGNDNVDSKPDSVGFILKDYPRIVAEQEENERGLLELAACIDQQNKTIDEQNKTIEDQQAEIVRLQQSQSAKDVTIAQLHKIVAEKDAQIAKLQSIVDKVQHLIEN